MREINNLSPQPQQQKSFIKCCACRQGDTVGAEILQSRCFHSRLANLWAKRAGNLVPDFGDPKGQKMQKWQDRCLGLEIFPTRLKFSSEPPTKPYFCGEFWRARLNSKRDWNFRSHLKNLSVFLGKHGRGRAGKPLPKSPWSPWEKPCQIHDLVAQNAAILKNADLLTLTFWNAAISNPGIWGVFFQNAKLTLNKFPDNGSDNPLRTRSGACEASPEQTPPLFDEGQITHLICARLNYDLYDLFGGCFGPASCFFSCRKGPKTPPKKVI